MTAYDRWLDRVAAREGRRPMLEESLLGGRFLAYAWHRLRLMTLARGLGLAIHVVEFVFLTRLFAAEELGASLAVQNGAAVAAAFWWGALELMRERLRARPHHTFTAEIARWMGRASVLSIGLAIVAGGSMVAHHVLTDRPWGILDAYIAVVVGRLVVDLPVRTLYSGVYARRRIYRPVAAVFVSELSGLLAVLAMWSWLGPWSFPLALGAAIAVSRGILVAYTLRAYDGMGVRRPGVRWAAAGEMRSSEDGPMLVAAGLANASTRVGSMLVLALVLSGRGAGPTVMALHLVAPLLVTGAAWAQVFYLDFKRLGDPLARALRTRLQRGLARMAPGVGILLWVVAMGLVRALVPEVGPHFLLALGPLLVAQAFLARLQLQFFARGHYGRVTAGFVALAGATIPALFLLPGTGDELPPLLVAAAGMVLAGAVIILLRREPDLTDSGYQRSMSAWVDVARRRRGPSVVGRIDLRWATHPQRRAAARWLAERLDASGAVCQDHAALIWIADEGHAISTRDLLVGTAGLCEAHRATDVHADGAAAVASARAMGLIRIPARGADERAASGIIDAFQREFPDGKVERLREDRGEAASALPVTVRQQVWRDAMLFARGGRGRRLSPYEVTAYQQDGAIEAVFLVPRSETGQKRVRWRERLRHGA